MKTKRLHTTIFYWLLMFLIVASSACSSEKKEKKELSENWKRFKAIFDFSNYEPPKDSAKYQLNLGDYEKVFSFINGIDKAHYDSLLKIKGGEVVWDTLQSVQMISYESDKRSIDPNYKVFGWHPFWMGSAFESYNFNLLTHISWFSYDVDPTTGAYHNAPVIKELKTEGLKLIKKAQEKDCKVLLTITNHGREKTRTFLANQAGQQNILIDSALHLVKTLNLNGLDINFENIHPGYGEEMTAFVKQLSGKLKALNENHVLSLTIPKILGNQIDDIESLNDFVDVFVLTGYDFHTAGSKKDGPIAPLAAPKGRHSIKTVVKSYLQKGIKKSKLLLGLPYYGGVWTSKDPEMQSTDRNFKRHLTYRGIMATYGKLGSPKHDPLSVSAYYLTTIDSSLYEKVWFDDSITLAQKFTWAKDTELGGIAIWSLGYDNGRKELWRTIDYSFASDSLANVPIKTNAGFRVANWLAQYQVPILITLLFWSVFVAAGFFISLFDWRVRNYLFNNKSSRLLFILSIYGFIVLIYLTILFFKHKSIFEGSTIFLMTGMLLGGGICGAIVWWFQRHRSRLP